MEKNNRSKGMYKKIMRLFFLYPIGLWLLFEEWGWEPLADLFNWLSKLPFWGWLERQILKLPPYGVLLIFGIPVIVLLPVKFLALYLFGKGHMLSGSILLISAKIIGTAVCARIFNLSKSTLMKISWFNSLYPRWKKWKDGMLYNIRHSRFWLNMHMLKIKIKDWMLKNHHAAKKM